MTDFPNSRRTDAGGKEAVLARLRQAGISPTVQRRRIAEVLFAKPQHLSAEEVLALVNLRGESVSKATIYNTLRLFLDRGLVREVIVDPARVFYDSNTGHHHHFYNDDTGELTDFTSPELRISGIPDLPPGTVSSSLELIVRVKAERGAGG
jgi:Fur family iron response transcriptional regulator